MDLFLHIGTEKTATSSTQRWFADNRDALRAQGVAYSRVLGSATHRKLCLWSLNPGRDDQGFLHIHLRSPAERAAFRDAMPGLFAAEVAQARADGCRHFVISNEHLQSRLITAQEVTRLRDFLSPHFSTITVVCALRPQVDVAVSLASTVSRDRSRVTSAFFDKVVPTRPYYDYAALVARWEAVFGAENLQLLAFRAWPTAAAWLIPRLGLDAARLPPIPRINEALDVRTMALVNALEVPLFAPDGRPNPFGNLFLDKLPCTDRLALGLEQAQAVQARFAASNAALTAAHPEITAADLTPDWRSHDRPANTALLEAPCVFSSQMAALVGVFNAQIQFQKLQTALAQTERAVARGRPDNARRFLTDAQALLQTLNRAKSLQSDLEKQRRQLATLSREIGSLDPAAATGQLDRPAPGAKPGRAGSAGIKLGGGKSGGPKSGGSKKAFQKP